MRGSSWGTGGRDGPPRRVVNPRRRAAVSPGMSVRHHLVHDHRRAWRDIDGLPVDEVHRFEHVEQALGLVHLDHWHGRDGGIRRGARPRL